METSPHLSSGSSSRSFAAIRRELNLRIPIVSLLTATLTITLLELVLPVTILQLYDRIVPNRSVETLSVLFFAAGGLLCVEFVLKACRAHLVALNGFAFAHRAGRRAIEAMLRNSVMGGALRPSEGFAILGSIRSIRDGQNGKDLVATAELLFVPVAIAIVGIIAGPLALVPLGLLIVFALASMINGRRLANANARRNESDDRRYDFIVEALSAIHTVKALAMEPRILRRYEALKQQSCMDSLAVSRAYTRSFDTAASFGTLLTFLMVLGGAALVMSERISVGAMIASVILAGRIGQPLQKALGMLLQRRNLVAETHRVASFLSASAPIPSKGIVPENRGLLELDAVTMRSLDGHALLERASLRLEPGQAYLLDAAGGEDRAAFFRAVAGLCDCETGEVRLNGTKITEIEQTVRAQQVAWLQRNPVIYRGTLMDNLSRFGSSSLADVLYVAKHLGLEDDVARLPRGLETMLQGDGADPIHPGLKQRVAIARQLSPRPKLILFDHADTGLDRRSYEAIQGLFSRLRGKATLVLATGDRTLQALATRRITIRDGRLDVDRAEKGAGLQVATYREFRI
ncbi:ATP-binding cassette subfamily C protein LapB [Palleronia aestuarii]|uniref:ATP-binding cassette subfamily C protein LapB n=1 Tax=Palleronia aestuarii TaxID=568105 RepID=A0A2W7MWF8_9RHOB|nr:ABC transporter transmembrane domain-containing protein [Palleronia aestuarii]PZX11893.1 ATP-binding cassette subfamily C protein LapB [Palleronia aestuarii]